jgi:hypothetical protein
VITSRIDMEDTVPGGFEVLIDPAGDALKILVGVA